jgi:hypothetical protein
MILKSLAFTLTLFATPAYAAQEITPGAPTIGQQLVGEFNGAGAGSSSPYIPVTPILWQADGDSRIENSFSVVTTGTASVSVLSGNGYPGWFGGAIHHIILDSASGHYGVGASTTAGLCGRLQDQGTAAANRASSGNLAFTTDVCNLGTAFVSGTGVGTDADFNKSSMGFSTITNSTAAPVNDPGNIVFYLDGVNDSGPTAYTSTLPTPLATMKADKKIFDAHHAAGHEIFLLDETPEGFSTQVEERHACVACSSFTVTNNTSPLAWDSFSGAGLVDDTNTIYTLVGSCSASTNTYSFSGGVVTFCSNKPPNFAIFSYDYGAGNTAGSGQVVYSKTLNEWDNSTASDFTSSASGSLVDYHIPGAAADPWVHPVQTYEAMIDSSSGTKYNAKHGYLDILHLHPQLIAGQVAASAVASALSAIYPSLTTDLSQSPIRNNYTPCNANGVAFTYSSVSCPSVGSFAFPAYMQGSYCPGTIAGQFQILVGGIPAAVNDGAGNLITATTANSPHPISFTNSLTVTTGTYNCATGAWSVTFSTKPTNALRIEIAEDPLNAISNGLLDAVQGVVALPANVTAAAGTSGTPLGWTMTLDTCTTNALAAGSMSITVATDASTSPITVTENGIVYPAVQITIKNNGTLQTGCSQGGNGQIQITNLANAITSWFNFATPDSFRGGLTTVVGPALGSDGNMHLYSSSGANADATMSAPSWTPIWASGAVTGITGIMMKDNGNVPYTDLSIGNVLNTYEHLTPLMSMQGMVSAPTAGSLIAQLGYIEGVPGLMSYTIYKGHLRNRTQ